MTPQDATVWLRQFAYAVDGNVYTADMFGASLRLGEFGKVIQYAQDDRFHRHLCIFVRRLVRLVDGYERPACGRCSDTGTEQREGSPAYCDCAAGTALIRRRYSTRRFKHSWKFVSAWLWESAQAGNAHKWFGSENEARAVTAAIAAKTEDERIAEDRASGEACNRLIFETERSQRWRQRRQRQRRRW